MASYQKSVEASNIFHFRLKQMATVDEAVSPCAAKQTATKH